VNNKTNWIYSKRNYVMHFIAGVSLIEIICIEFNLGYKIIPETLAKVMLNICYAIFTSWVFYSINILIPQLIEKREISPVYQVKIFFLIHRIDSYFAEISVHILKGRITKEELNMLLAKIEGNINIDAINNWRKCSLDMISEINSLVFFIDHNVIKLVNDISILLTEISFEYKVEDETLVESYGELIYALYEKTLMLEREYDKRKIKLEYNLS
jgi:hypothetical protein